MSSRAQLLQAVKHGETFFVKVHAAQNLILHQCTKGLEEEFLPLLQDSPDTAIGSARVLARLNKDQPAYYEHYLRVLLRQFNEGTSPRIRLTALESLGKLEYGEPLAAVSAYADTGTNGSRAMTRWVLANRVSEQTANRLPALTLESLRTTLF